jgi:tRNA threonylcarbamoyladenosine biosynthesis protein TsaB
MEAKLLVLETSGPQGAVGLGLGSLLISQRALDAGRRHNRDLAPTVGDLLEEAGWKPKELAGVVVSCGPGSYTGLRVGIMSAKTLAFATGCKLLGVPTFAVIARQTPAHIEQVDILADAQQQLVYCQTFQRQPNEKPLALADLAIVPFADWLARRAPSAWVSGPVVDKFDKEIPAEVNRVPAEFRSPTLATLLELGFEQFQAGQFADPWTLEPLYLRPSSAEEKWTALKKPEIRNPKSEK